MAGNHNPEDEDWSARTLADAIRTKYADRARNTVVPWKTELAAEFVTQRKTVGRALALLQREMFVKIVPGKRATFTGMRAAVMNPDGMARAGIAEVLAFRLCIEPGAAMLAALQCRQHRDDPGFWGELRAAHDRLADLADGPVNAWLRADQAFHAAFHALVGNPLVEAVLRQTSLFVSENVRDVVTRLFHDRVYREKTQEQHEAIYEGIVNCPDGDHHGELAWKATFDHLSYAHALILAGGR